MTNRFACWMNGQGLTDIDPAILILDVTESAPDMEVLATPAVGCGMRVTGITRRSLAVTVTFALRERSPVRRAALLERIAAWAGGSVLTVSHRPGQRLRCQCTALPEPGSALRWYAALSVTFTAFACPYWEAVQPAAAWISPAAASGSTVLLAPGTAPATPAEVLVINQSAEIVNDLRIVCGETFFAFTNLALAPGERLLADYDIHGRLRLTILGETSRSVMDRRTAGSSDDLLAVPRTPCTVEVTADHPVTAKFTARGRFL